MLSTMAMSISLSDFADIGSNRFSLGYPKKFAFVAPVAICQYNNDYGIASKKNSKIDQYACVLALQRRFLHDMLSLFSNQDHCSLL